MFGTWHADVPNIPAGDSIPALLHSKFDRARDRCLDIARQEQVLDLGPVEFKVTAPEGERALRFDPVAAYTALREELSGLRSWCAMEVQRRSALPVTIRAIMPPACAIRRRPARPTPG